MKTGALAHVLAVLALWGSMVASPLCWAQDTALGAPHSHTVVKAEKAIRGWQLQMDEYQGERAGDRHPWRMATELAASVGVGSIFYWVWVDTSINDWEYGLDRKSLYDKYVTLGGIRFDDNQHHLNSPGHPAAGGLYYFLARKNGFNQLEAFGATTVAALAWELISEYREVVSINDMIFTPVAGAPLGEAFFASVSYLQNSSHSPGRWVAKAFSVVDYFHMFLEGNPNPLHEEAHALTFSPGTPSHVDVYVGALSGLGGSLTQPYAATGWRFGASSEIWRIPGIFLPGASQVLFADTARADLNAEATLTTTGLLDHRIEGSTTLLGLYWQDIWHDKKERHTGFGVMAAAQSDFSHVEHNGLSFDRLARVGLVGASGEVFGAIGPAKMRLRLDLSPDFASVTAPVLQKKPNFLEGIATKSVLDKEGYYYAAGLSAHLRFVADVGPFEAKAGLAARAYESIDGLDREQALVEEELHGSDRRLEANIGLQADLPFMPLALAGEMVQRWQRGSLDEATAETSVTLLTLSLLFRL